MTSRLAPLFFVLACSSTAVTVPDAAAPDGSPAPDTGVPPDANAPDTDAESKDVGTPRDLGEGPDRARLTGARSFVVEGKLTVKPPVVPTPIMPPDRHDFLLRLDPAASTILVGGPGNAARVPAKTSDGLTFTSAGPLQIAVPGGYAPCGDPTVAYDTFTATVAGDRVTGSAQGTMMLTQGDQIFSTAVSLVFSGRLDDAGPTFPADLTAVDPLALLPVRASEPLPMASSARLVPAPGSAAPEVILQAISPSMVPDVVTRFYTPAGALAYATTYQLVLGPPAADLAGNGAGPGPAITTQPLPPVVPPDGFESAGAGAGGARVVDATTLPPITGQRSLLLAAPLQLNVPGPTRFTARLAVKAGDQRVRFAARVIASSDTLEQYQVQNIVLRTAVSGGAIVVGGPIDWRGPLTATPPQPNGRQIYLGQVRTVELPLPAGTKDEVVVDLNTGVLGGGCGLYPPLPGLLIDDLRVE